VNSTYQIIRSGKEGKPSSRTGGQGSRCETAKEPWRALIPSATYEDFPSGCRFLRGPRLGLVLARARASSLEKLRSNAQRRQDASHSAVGGRNQTGDGNLFASPLASGIAPAICRVPLHED